MTDVVITKAWKGFDQDFRCLGYQFEVGGEYTHDGPVKVCESGLHACTQPLDVLAYYPAGTSRYAEVELVGETQSHDEDSKLCGSTIRIVREISYADLWRAHRKMTASAEKEASATGYAGHAHATGDHGHASATGDYGRASATGYRGHASATGDYGHAHAAGYCGHASATGDQSIAASLGPSSTAAAGDTGWIVLAEYDDDGRLIMVRAAAVGTEGIEPGKTYRLRGGVFVEA